MRCVSLLPSASALARGAIVRPFSSPARSESSATNAPFTSTKLRVSTPGNGSCFFACSIAFLSGSEAKGAASRISARRSVYFHSSTRRCGRPLSTNALPAASRNFLISPAPGKRSRAASMEAASACSAGVRMGRISAFMSGRLLKGRVALRFEFFRELRPAGLYDLALRHDMHDVRHDVVQEPLIVRDDDEGALLRAQLVHT